MPPQNGIEKELNLFHPFSAYEELVPNQRDLKLKLEANHAEICALFNAINNKLDGMSLHQQPRICAQSIDCECADCVDECLQGSYLSGAMADSTTECLENGEFTIGTPHSNSVIIGSVEILADLFLDEFFMEHEETNHTYKVFDQLTELNVEPGYDFETFDNMCLAEIFMEPKESKPNFYVPDPIKELNEVIEIGELQISCLSTISPSYFAYEKQHDDVMLMFDPGGNTLELKKRLMESIAPASASVFLIECCSYTCFTTVNCLYGDMGRGSNEQLKLDIMLVSCLLDACSAYLFNGKQTGVSMLVFDPGGVVVEVLSCGRRILFNCPNQSKELLNESKFAARSLFL